jgi:hypothetical protein
MHDVARQLRPILHLWSILPELKHGSGNGDCMDGGGRFPAKENGPTPLERLSSFRQPGRAALNSPPRGWHDTHTTGEKQEINRASDAAPLERNA